jgi:hypothetical protein
MTDVRVSRAELDRVWVEAEILPPNYSDDDVSPENSPM